MIDQRKIYKNDFYPSRILFLWGKDFYNNPGFVILYGLHKFEKNENDENILEDDISYTNYTILKGAKGHFPSFPEKKVLRSHSNNSLKHEVLFPYFEKLSHEDYVKRLNLENIKFHNFTLVKNPLEVLNLNWKIYLYYNIIYELFCNPNIYLRKKYLKELISSNPPKEIYDFILKLGSSELISGLFLELGFSKNYVLIEEAKQLINSHIDWVSKSYADGIKRCASIYINSFDEKLKDARVNFIRSTLSHMDLHVVHVAGVIIPEDRIIEGAAYRKYANSGYLRGYFYEYSRKERKYIKKKRSDLYKESYYSDGAGLNINHFKNTLQEAEIYGLADVVGKIAYYLDAPRLVYYFKGNSNNKALMYFRRYVRRIMDYYAKYDEEKFIEAMKALLTSYTNSDYLCKFKGNFQFNYFIKHYLYFDFTEKAPWSVRYEWMRDDQLMKLEGRYEFMKKVWNEHLDDLVEIIQDIKIDVILKAFYYILNDSENFEYLTTNLDYEKLINLISSKYESISDMFMNILTDKLEKENSFNLDIMGHLMKCPSKKVHKIAMEYFKRTEGSLSHESLIGLMFFEDANDWMDLLKDNIEKLNMEEYIKFLYKLFKNSDKFIKFNIIWSDDLTEALHKSLDRINTASIDQKIDLIRVLIDEFKNNHSIPDSTFKFMENALFSIPLVEIETILKEIDIDLNSTMVTEKVKLILSFLNFVENNTIPSDMHIMEIIEASSSKMVKALIDIIFLYKDQLYSRFSTILIMLETGVIQLNNLAKKIFCTLEKEDEKKLHAMIMDSPDKKVYTYGLEKIYEIYEKQGEFIPEEFVLKMLEHPSCEIRSYISDRVNNIINNLGNGNKEIFMYYAKTLLYLPNKVSRSKKNIYDVLPSFANKYEDKRGSIEEMLLDIGSSNIISDSERALVTFARIKKGVI